MPKSEPGDEHIDYDPETRIIRLRPNECVLVINAVSFALIPTTLGWEELVDENDPDTQLAALAYLLDKEELAPVRMMLIRRVFEDGQRRDRRTLN